MFGMVSPVPTIGPRKLATLDAPVRALFELVAQAVPVVAQAAPVAQSMTRNAFAITPIMAQSAR